VITYYRSYGWNPVLGLFQPIFFANGAFTTQSVYSGL
jgi:hypothetical protein